MSFLASLEDVLCSESSADDMHHFGFKVITAKGTVSEGIYTDTCLTNVLKRLNENFGELSYCYVEVLPDEMDGMTLIP